MVNPSALLPPKQKKLCRTLAKCVLNKLLSSPYAAELVIVLCKWGCEPVDSSGKQYRAAQLKFTSLERDVSGRYVTDKSCTSWVCKRLREHVRADNLVWCWLAYVENTICLAVLFVCTPFQPHLHFRAPVARSQQLGLFTSRRTQTRHSAVLFWWCSDHKFRVAVHLNYKG